MSRDLRQFIAGILLILLTPAGFVAGLLWAMGDEPMGRCDRPSHHHVDRVHPMT